MQSSSAYIPSFSLSTFAETVTAPYTSLKAFSSGVIDGDGNLLKPESSIDPYEYFIIKLKKIFDQLPMSYTKARLASYVSTFQMFNEEAQSFGLNSNEFLFFIEGYLESNLLINEDMGVGTVSGGAPGTLGTAQVVQNSGGVMGYDKPLGAPMFTRMPVEMFDVDDNEFQNFKKAKAWKHVPDSETKRYLKRFQQRNPSGKMAIRSSNKDIHWLSYSPKSFMEEYGLEGLDILNENKNNNIESSEIEFKKKDEERILTPQQVHDSFAKHLEKQNLIRVKSPDVNTRKNPEALKLFHSNLPHGTFYVGENPDIGHGDDAFVKIDDELHGGIELKKSKLSASRSKKPPRHGMQFGIGRKLLDMAAERFERQSEVSKKPSLIKNAFSGLLNSSELQKLTQAGAEKEIENKGNLIIGGHFDGVHVLSSARRKTNPVYNKHNELAKKIGLSLTGNIRDWGSTQKSGFVKARPKKLTDQGISLKTKVELKPVPEDHQLRAAYKSNASFLNI